MSRILTIRRAFVGFGLAALLAGCSTPPPPPPPAPPPPAPPPIALNSTVLQDAAGYQTYMRRAANISDDFHNGDDVAQSLKIGAAYDSAAAAAGGYRLRRGGRLAGSRLRWLPAHVRGRPGRAHADGAHHPE